MKTKINFKKPRYVIPLLIFPFLFILFYVYQDSFAKEKKEIVGKDSLQVEVAGVSRQVKSSHLSDKLEAYRSEYKNADGYTAVTGLNDEEEKRGSAGSLYNEREKRMLDSIDKVMKRRYGEASPASTKTNFPAALSDKRQKDSYAQDRALAEALSKINKPAAQPSRLPKNEPGAMEIFRAQMALVDSMGKANDPEYRKKLIEEKNKKEAEAKLATKVTVPATKALKYHGFNMVKNQSESAFLSAVIDEDITGFSGSRLRIRLLDDMMAGQILIPKGNYLYAVITGFTGQRALLNVSSIMLSDNIIPVNLELYDKDGLKGIYVPASAFREFSRDLGAGSSQGISLQQMAENNNQLVMGMLQKMFQSTTSAVGKLIRSNKAKIKYNTQVLLIDPEQLQKKQNSY
ncbi:conjugative transposon protein TraM [Pedobacter aquatilis]|uniref:conjugative transposon protein TraM n=1 Tax=Pedobacter aquatilis TaxID=351343 RepID=UPI00292E93AA|nr:conjugative transposon protein TraM [Pedobacter aquatilis]